MHDCKYEMTMVQAQVQYRASNTPQHCKHYTPEECLVLCRVSLSKYHSHSGLGVRGPWIHCNYDGYQQPRGNYDGYHSHSSLGVRGLCIHCNYDGLHPAQELSK